MAGGRLIPQIEEVLAAKNFEEFKRLNYEALKAIAESLPQVDIIRITGAPENEIKAAQGATLALNIDENSQGDGVLFFKSQGEEAGDQSKGWKQVQTV